jgi:hypothetical protein
MKTTSPIVQGVPGGSEWCGQSALAGVDESGERRPELSSVVQVGAGTALLSRDTPAPGQVLPDGDSSRCGFTTGRGAVVSISPSKRAAMAKMLGEEVGIAPYHIRQQQQEPATGVGGMQ